MQILLTTILLLGNIMATESLDNLNTETEDPSVLNDNENEIIDYKYIFSEGQSIIINRDTVHNFIGILNNIKLGKHLISIRAVSIVDLELLNILLYCVEHIKQPMEFDLDNIQFNSYFINEIISCIKKLNIISLKFTKLRIYFNDRFVSDFFINNNNLQKLHIENCNLEIKDIQCISSILNNKEIQLTSLILDENQKGKILLENLIQNVENNEILEILEICYKNQMSIDIISHIERALTSYKALKQLKIFAVDYYKKYIWSYNHILTLKKDSKVFECCLSSKNLSIANRTLLLNKIADNFNFEGKQIKWDLDEDTIKYAPDGIQNNYFAAKRNIILKNRAAKKANKLKNK